MRVELLHDTNVRFIKGTVLEVSDAEAARLIALCNAKAVKAAEAPAGNVEAKKEKKSTKKGSAE